MAPAEKKYIVIKMLLEYQDNVGLLGKTHHGNARRVLLFVDGCLLEERLTGNERIQRHARKIPGWNQTLDVNRQLFTLK